MTPLEAAREYCRRGWRVIPVPFGEKGPRIPGWQKLTLGLDDLPQHFGGACNVGVGFGASNELVDLDLDCREALELADLYLPATGAEFGRPSKPRSHRLFVAVRAAFEAFTDPAAGEEEKSTLLEVRAGPGHQTIFPPSVADGEQREWCADVVAPRIIDAVALRRAAAWLAVGCLVMRHVSEHAASRPGPDLPRLLWEADHDLGRAAYGWLGQSTPDAPQPHPRHRRELSRAELDLAELVAAIPNNCDWTEWNRIGMAIYVASGGSAEGGIVFDDFSAKNSKYNPYNTTERWQHYGRSPPSRVTAGTLVYLARQHGWKGRPR